MGMSFEKWVPQTDFDNFPASATIVQSRLIRVATPVANLLKLRGKTSAHLFYDKKRKVIGIRAIDKKEEGTAKIRQSSKSTSIHVPSFFRHYQIDVPGIKRFHCWYDEKEKMAMIDISRPSPRGRPAGS
jgi:hypothetical protein